MISTGNIKYEWGSMDFNFDHIKPINFFSYEIIDTSEIRNMINYCVDRLRHLVEWQINFIKEIMNDISREIRLTVEKLSTLLNIYNKLRFHEIGQ